MRWLNLLFGRPILVLATLGLSIAGWWGNPERPWKWIIGLAAFIIFHEVGNFVREKSISSQLGRNREIVQRRVLRLISDLSDLTAREFDIWMVDLYLPRRSFSLFDRPHVVVKLVRELSMSLTDVRNVPPYFRTDDELFGRSFLQSRPKLWWDGDLTNSSLGENLCHRLDEVANRRLQETYGVISVNPIVDDLGKDCRGIVVVHTKRDSEIATKALGALTQATGARRLAEASHDIHKNIAM